MSEVKPREFWTNPDSRGYLNIQETCPVDYPKTMHLIEHSAYEKLQARLLEYDGKTYSENEEIKKLKSDAFEDTKKLYAQSQEIEKLKAENAELIADSAKVIMSLKGDNEALRNNLKQCLEDRFNYMDQITKLTHQRDTLKKCAEFYADKENWDERWVEGINGDDDYAGDVSDVITNDDVDVEDDEGGMYWTNGGKTARKALRDVEGGENEKA